MRPPFPHVIDSSMIASFRACPQKFFREYMQHYKPATPSVHLHAGAAYARGLEVTRTKFYDEGICESDATAYGLDALMRAYGDYDPQDSAKSLERMAGAFEFYFDRYPLATDDAKPVQLGSRHAIEFSFAEPLESLHPETGDPIIFCGRADMIAEFAGGIYIFDDKTTSSLGASWTKQWEMRSQFSGYCWAAKRAGIAVNGVLVRGISILKTKYDTQQAITSRADWEIARWYDQVLLDIERMVEMWKTGYWDYNLDHACAEYGGCMFLNACKSPDPQPWLDLYFTKRIWDPLLREEREATE